MTKTKWIRLIFGIILSISLIAAGLCLIGACISIYQSGDRPFSRESVALYFSQIAVPVYIALALTIVGFILNSVYHELLIFSIHMTNKKKSLGTAYIPRAFDNPRSG